MKRTTTITIGIFCQVRLQMKKKFVAAEPDRFLTEDSVFKRKYKKNGPTT
jgi:hypothetical protein